MPGKGIGAVIPNLLHYPGSVVVTDPKGENHAVTARRRRELGSCVYALDPFGVVHGTAAFNPLDLVDATVLHVRDQQAGGVGADVDHAHAHGAGS